MSALHASWMRSVQHLSNPTLQRARDLFKIHFRVDVLTGLVHVVDEDHQCIADPLRTEGVPCVVLCFTTLPVLNKFVEHQLAPLVQHGNAAVEKYLYDGAWNPLKDLLNKPWEEGPHRRLDDFVNDVTLAIRTHKLIMEGTWSRPKIIEAGAMVLQRHLL